MKSWNRETTGRKVTTSLSTSERVPLGVKRRAGSAYCLLGKGGGVSPSMEHREVISVHSAPLQEP